MLALFCASSVAAPTLKPAARTADSTVARICFSPRSLKKWLVPLRGAFRGVRAPRRRGEGQCACQALRSGIKDGQRTEPPAPHSVAALGEGDRARCQRVRRSAGSPAGAPARVSNRKAECSLRAPRPGSLRRRRASLRPRRAGPRVTDTTAAGRSSALVAVCGLLAVALPRHAPRPGPWHDASQRPGGLRVRGLDRAWPRPALAAQAARYDPSGPPRDPPDRAGLQTRDRDPPPRGPAPGPRHRPAPAQLVAPPPSPGRGQPVRAIMETRRGSSFHYGLREDHDMSADQQEGALKPIAPARVAEELKKLSTQRQEGQLDADEYEHRFARMIGELRDRRIDGSRAEILATLTPLLRAGRRVGPGLAAGSPASSDSREPGAASDVRPGFGRTDPEGRADLPCRGDGPQLSARGPRPPVSRHP